MRMIHTKSQSNSQSDNRSNYILSQTKQKRTKLFLKKPTKQLNIALEKSFGFRNRGVTTDY